MAFGNRKSSEIQGIGQVGSMHTHAIDNVYYVNGLQHNSLSVSQMCDKGNNVLCIDKECRVAGKLVILGSRHKNVYKTNIIQSQESILKCVSAVSDCFYALAQKNGTHKLVNNK